MLRIYREGGGKGGLGLEVERWEGVVREVGSDPIGVREMSDGEKKVCANLYLKLLNFWSHIYTSHSFSQGLSILNSVDANQLIIFRRHPRSPLEEKDRDSTTTTRVLQVRCGKGSGLSWESGGISQVTFQSPFTDP
jgi:hypothetical protein